MSFLKKNTELLLLIIHALIGFVVFVAPFSSLLINVIIIAICFILIFSSKNKVVSILIASAYIATSDVFFRMTGGLIFHELHKYLLIVFCILGIFFCNVSGKGLIYLFYIVLLLVSIFFTEYNFSDNIRKMIAFNLAGPVSLGIMAFFCYRKRVSLAELNKVFFYALLPIVSLVVYLIIYNPSIKDSITGTASNFATSGGFGPNQVTTVLGVGIFILATRLMLSLSKGMQKLLEIILLVLITFRGLVTFSRGGIITAIVAISLFVIIIYLQGNKTIKLRLSKILFLSIFGVIGIWLFAVNRTSGQIENRYSNKNASGISKEDVSSGRKDLFMVEIDAFLESPLFGIGIGKNKEYRFEKTGTLAATHNEISRLLAEHGSLGVLAIIILVLAPMALRSENKKNIYFYSCFFMWLLTINHSAMRIAFPSFIYGLALLNVQFERKITTKSENINTR